MPACNLQCNSDETLMSNEEGTITCENCPKRDKSYPMPGMEPKPRFRAKRIKKLRKKCFYLERGIWWENSKLIDFQLKGIFNVHKNIWIEFENKYSTKR